MRLLYSNSATRFLSLWWSWSRQALYAPETPPPTTAISISSFTIRPSNLLGIARQPARIVLAERNRSRYPMSEETHGSQRLVSRSVSLNFDCLILAGAKPEASRPDNGTWTVRKISSEKARSGQQRVTIR